MSERIGWWEVVPPGATSGQVVLATTTDSTSALQERLAELTYERNELLAKCDGLRAECSRLVRVIESGETAKKLAKLQRDIARLHRANKPPAKGAA